MALISDQHSNFGLTPEDFADLTERLMHGDETLFENIFLHHFGKCIQYLKKKYKAAHDDAYDAVMWTMLRIRQLIAEKKVAYGNLEGYVMRMAANYYLKQQTRNQEIPTDTFTDAAIDEPSPLEEMLPVLEKAWRLLGNSCQTLLKGFYYDKIELKQLTILLNDSSEANTRKKKERCLLELKKLFFAAI